MKTQTLTIGTIQISFDSTGAALFRAPGKQRSAIEHELNEYREFIDRWLETSEDLQQHKFGPEEQDLRETLKLMTRALRSKFDRAYIEMVMRAIAKQERYGNVGAEQIDESIAEALSKL